VKWPKRVPERGENLPLSCANAAEVQVDLDGRIHPKPAPLWGGCPLPLTCQLIELI
jgi:hypothetical protein